MNILYIINSANPGGMEQHVLDLVVGMQNKGHKVFVWCQEGIISQWYLSAGAKVTSQKIKYDIDPVYIYKLVRFIKENKIEVIHAHELKAGVNALLAGLFGGVEKRITHIHTPMSLWKVRGSWMKFITKVQIICYSKLINLIGYKEVCLTESGKSIKIKEGIKIQKLIKIPNGINFDRFNLSQEQRVNFRNEVRRKYQLDDKCFIFGNVSRMTAEKGHLILLEAFSKFINEHNPDSVYLLLCGGGELITEVQKKVHDLRLEHRVFITGIFSDSELPKFYSAFDAFLFPSLAEGFGFVMIEAMYTGLPVLSSDLEVLKEVSGGLIEFFPPQNVNEFSKMISEMYFKYKDNKTNLNDKYNNVIGEYTLDKFISNYENLYL